MLIYTVMMWRQATKLKDIRMVSQRKQLYVQSIENSVRKLYSTEKKLASVAINDNEIQLKNKVFINENQ